MREQHLPKRDACQGFLRPFPDSSKDLVVKPGVVLVSQTPHLPTFRQNFRNDEEAKTRAPVVYGRTGSLCAANSGFRMGSKPTDGLALSADT